ncbi:MAG: tRNA (guanosine(46)-N7)-methyltransferase TrmB, partial [Pseudomonadota bacterium]
MEGIFPSLCLITEQLTENGDIAPSSLFDKPYEQYVYEIGFGMGEHLAATMKEHPDAGFFGAEPYVNGMAAFCKAIKDQDKNVRLVMDD